MLSAMDCAKPRRNLALLQKPWSAACASQIKKSPLAFLQKPTKLVIRILLVLTLPGDEHNYSPEDIRPLIEQVKSYHRPMTLHAGECHCPHFVAQSIAFGIKRNGHVTALSHEPALLQSFIEHGVTGELCLTSNLQTKAAPTIEDFLI